MFGKSLQILVIYDAGCLADVARAAQPDGRWDGSHGGAPNASGNGVPGNLNWISRSQSAHIGFIDESADQHFSQIRHLQQKISGRDEAALLGGQRVHDAIKRSANIRFRQDVLRGIVGGLRFRLLRSTRANSAFEYRCVCFCRRKVSWASARARAFSASRTSPAEAAPSCTSFFSASKLRWAASRSVPAFTSWASRFSTSSWLPPRFGGTEVGLRRLSIGSGRERPGRARRRHPERPAVGLS